ncbi:hypothetical protein BGZ95_003450 [Linnemannia exigua]|uniref:DUF143-domain-containing protein n=1 Tax=Linnemannia exigua TaxID=604196 RepID=A0AAD4DI96_9FUNG|nr:hypothetical protein BGZ95_003450 [Linnemannia exigua]
MSEHSADSSSNNSCSTHNGSDTATSKAASLRASATASVVDQDLDDPHNQQAIDAVDLNSDVELKLRHNSRDTSALLDKDQLGNGVVEGEEQVVISSSSSTTTNTTINVSAAGGQSILLEDKQRSEDEFSWTLYHFGKSTGINANKDDKDKGKQDDLQNAPVAIRGLVRMLEHERARNVTVMDMRQKCDWTDWMVIAEGVSERHVGNVADEVYSALKKMLPKTSPPLMEGRSTPDWVVIDTGAIIVHFMTHETRKERNLEGLWGAVKDPLKLKDAKEISWEDVQTKLTESWNESDHAAATKKTTHGKSKKGGGAAGAGHGTKRSRRGDEDLTLEEVVKG